MTEHEKSRKHYEQSGTYDQNMEYFEECEVNSGAWVLITRQIPVDERCKPHLFGIYWGIPKQDRFDRQVCVVHTTEDVTLLKEWDETIHDTRHTLYPVCGDSIDHVIGILNAKDYFRLKEKSKDMVIDSAISAPYFVMETTKADVLFKNMKQSKQSMAIVLDEYGGVVGIVTLFDLLEEIVGDLNDIEPISSEEETVIIRISDNKWEVKGNIRLSDIEDAIGVTFTAEDCDTFTGFVFQKFGMVPKDGDTKIELEIENMHIIIDKIKEHQVEHAIIEILE